MSEDAPEQEAEEPVPESRPRRKKKRRAEVEAAIQPATTQKRSGGSDRWWLFAGLPIWFLAKLSAPVEALTDEEKVPAFARRFPRDPDLDALVLAFEAGDYARVRREAPKLAKSTDRDDVRAAARELRRRLDPDPLAVFLLGIAAVLLVVLFGYYGLHAH